MTIDEELKVEIRSELNQIEQKYDVTILFAVCGGSHSQGIANKESDFDIQCVHVSDVIEYVGLDKVKPYYQWESTVDDVEYESWDISRFLKLLYESNNTAIEVLQSNVVIKDHVLKSELREYMQQQFDVLDLYHDYRSSAKNNYLDYLSNHLTSQKNNRYDVIGTTEEGYKVETYDNDSIMVPYEYVDVSEKPPETGFVLSDEQTPDGVDGWESNHPFVSTQYDVTVKRVLHVLLHSLRGKYIQETGKRMDCKLPSIDAETLLKQQVKKYVSDSVYESGLRLLELKRRNKSFHDENEKQQINDVVTSFAVKLPRNIQPDEYSKQQPQKDDLNVIMRENITL